MKATRPRNDDTSTPIDQTASEGDHTTPAKDSERSIAGNWPGHISTFVSGMLAADCKDPTSRISKC